MTKRSNSGALTETLASETVDNQNYPIWRRESIKILPPATFVWLDQLNATWQSAFSENRLYIEGERPGDRELNLLPLIQSNVAELIYEGFDDLLIRPNPTSNNSQVAVIGFEELHHYMMLDPLYGMESAATKSIVNNIYRENAGNELFQQFNQRFSLLSCENDKLRHLIYLWCGLMGLPAYRGNQPLDWQQEDFLEHWTESFDLQLDEIKKFMREHTWPLPTRLFPDEADNTERALALGEAEFNAVFHDCTVELPKLEEDLAELKGITPESIAARQQKKKEIEAIERQIAAMLNGDKLNSNETPDERKQRLEAWYREERELRGEFGSLNRTAKREGIKRQTLSDILKR